MMCHAFSHSARVDENQSGAVRLNQFCKPTIDFLQNFIRYHCFKRRLRKLDRQIHFAAIFLMQQSANSSEWFLKVFADVVAQRFERRDVNDLYFIRQIGLCALAEQRVERSEKRCQRFARTCRRGNQHMPAGLNWRPAAHLRLGWRSKRLLEPLGDCWMKLEGLHEFGTINLRGVTAKKSYDNCCSRVALRRVARGLQTHQRRASHSEA